ncbi:MAG: hypothetical protein HOP29_06795 [Phycisphaerales bacterium]|nr:hypothetical protein [Phycisphaerales bacterium]
MMIAIAILGMGLLLAATMFPAGWLRARELAEFTSQVNAAESAMTTLQLMTRVAGPVTPPTAPPTYTESSFLGDFPPNGPLVPDKSVHVLHVENMLIDPDAPQVVANDPLWPEGFLHTSGPAFDNQMFAIQTDETEVNWWATVLPTVPPTVPPKVQVPFQDRLIPPMPRRGKAADIPPPTATWTTAQRLEQWDKQLSGRRFAWAMLYRFDEIAADPLETRSMTVYVVTLRRTRPNQRFARQDPQLGAAMPDAKWTMPKALSFEDDVAFPVAWLVQLTVEGNWNAGGVPLQYTAVPSEALANPVPPVPESRLIAQMLLSGSRLIDYKNGNIYEVTSHRFTGGGSAFDQQATVTLDRQVVVADVDDDPVGAPGHDVADPDEYVRLFWVFPPSVERNRPEDGFVTFEGPQPVVGIETRQVFMAPRVN